MLNEKFLEIIKRVMSEYNYSLVTSIAQNGDESYIVSKNQVFFSIKCDKNLGDSIQNKLKTELQKAGANVKLSKPVGRLFFKLCVKSKVRYKEAKKMMA